MPPLADHLAVERFGHEFPPKPPLEHVCAFGGVGTVPDLAVSGGRMLDSELLGRGRMKVGV